VKNKNTIKRILSITGNVVFYIILAALLIFSIANMRIKKANDIPNALGYGFLSVVSDSMEGSKENSFDKGDLIIVRMLNDKSIKDLKEGDIVTFYDWNILRINTHRIVEVGSNYVITQGDKAANSAAYVKGENNEGKQYETVLHDDLIAVHRSTWSNAGTSLEKLQTPVGFAIAIILPVFVLLVIQGINLARAVLSISKNKMEEKHLQDKEKVLQELEAEKEKLRKELLEELKKEQQNKQS
jgi:signal peptidase